MVHSLAGELMGGKLARARPFRAPHHSASMAALVGGGSRPRPGEVSLAHLGVLFLDELPEFQPQVLDALRQPLETGETVIARANHRIAYPSRIQLIAAMNPCKCGGGEPGQACQRGPRCADDYQARISGPAARPHRSADRGAGRSRPPISCCRRLARAAPRCAPASPPRASGSVRALPRSGCASVRTNAECAGALLEEIAMPDARRARRCCARPPTRSALSAAAIHRDAAGRAHAGRPRRRREGRRASMSPRP